MSGGVLYGVGVGPGAPDLLTLRALNVLRSADVVAFPRSSPWGNSTAHAIVAQALGDVPGQQRIFLTFPMSYDLERVQAAKAAAWATIEPELALGRKVAFATEGDPSLYSTFLDLQRAARERMPGLRIEVVPGVSSLNAVAAATGIALADGAERVAIIPGAYDIADLEHVLTRFDTTVLMKIGPNMNVVVEAIERLGLLDRTVYVSRATMEAERVVRDVRAIRELRGDCFAMLVVAKNQPRTEPSP